MFKSNMLIQLIKRYKYLLILIITLCIGIFFRFYQLDSVPPSPSVDEVATGYNAYSILQTGRDEYGTFMPVLLRSYDDYKPGIYVYLVIPFIKFLGLSVLAVRLPSAILSVISIFALYKLIKILFRKYGHVEELALVSAFLFAISPWHIYISRLGFETNIALSFFVFSLVFFFRKNILSMLLFFGLSFASYQSEKIFIPFYAVSLTLLFYKSFLHQWKRFLLGSILLVFFLSPFLIATFSPGALLRFSGTNIISANVGTIEKAKFDQELIIDSQNHDRIGMLIHNRRLFYANILFQSYIAHFDPYWLFTNFNNNGQFKVPSIGLLYLVFMPLYLLGIIVMFLINIDKKIKWALILWIALSPIPAAITTGAPHAIRAYPLVIVAQIVGGLGFIYILFLMKTTVYRVSIILIMILSSSYSMMTFYHGYFYAFPKKNSQDFQYAMKMSMNYVVPHQHEYTQVIISNRDNLYQSYMYYLFYSQYSPQKYQKSGGTISGGYAQIHTIDNIIFRRIDWDKDIYLKNTLLLGNNLLIKSNIKRTKIFQNMDGKSTIALVKT